MTDKQRTKSMRESDRRACAAIQTFLLQGHDGSLPDEVWQAYVTLRQTALDAYAMSSALLELRHWPHDSVCFDGSRAKSAAASLANARRFAGDALRKIGIDPEPWKERHDDT